MEKYEIWGSTKIMEDFVDNLSNWYIRRSRKRFWKSENDLDKKEAYQTLYHVLITFSKLLAPFMPFTSEEIYLNLKTEKFDSVHMTDWPKADKKMIKPALNEEMRLIRSIVNLGHALRSKANIKVRQPLAKVRIVSSYKFDEEQKKVILEELNIKELENVTNVEEIAEKFALPNPRVLGPKFGKDVQEIIKLAKAGKFEILENGKIAIGKWTVAKEEVEVGYKGKEGFDVLSEGGIVVGLDLKITSALKEEGYAREIVRFIQEMRKTANYNVSEHIETYIITDTTLETAIKNFDSYIKKETLSNEINYQGIDKYDLAEEHEIDGEKIKIGIKRE